MIPVAIKRARDRDLINVVAVSGKPADVLKLRGHDSDDGLHQLEAGRHQRLQLFVIGLVHKRQCSCVSRLMKPVAHMLIVNLPGLGAKENGIGINTYGFELKRHRNPP